MIRESKVPTLPKKSQFSFQLLSDISLLGHLIGKSDRAEAEGVGTDCVVVDVLMSV